MELAVKSSAFGAKVISFYIYEFGTNVYEFLISHFLFLLV